MNEQILAELKKQTDLLNQILAQHGEASPNYRRKMAAYQTFDWASIGAEVVTSDQHGVNVVLWNNHQFIRRSGTGKFGNGIWFSRATGQGENGTEYARLITFKDFEVESLSVPLEEKQELPPLPPRHWSDSEENRLKMAENLANHNIPITVLFSAVGVLDWDGMNLYEGTGKEAFEQAKSYWEKEQQPEPLFPESEAA